MSKNDKKDKDGSAGNWVDTTPRPPAPTATDTTWRGNTAAPDPVRGGGRTQYNPDAGKSEPVRHTGGGGFSSGPTSLVGQDAGSSDASGVGHMDDITIGGDRYQWTGTGWAIARDPITGPTKDPDWDKWREQNPLDPNYVGSISGGPNRVYYDPTRPQAPGPDGVPWGDPGPGTGKNTNTGGGRTSHTNTTTKTNTSTGRPRPTKTSGTLTSTSVQTTRDALDEKQKPVCKARPKDNRPKGGGGGRKRAFIPWC